MAESANTEVASKPYLDEDCVLFHGVSYLGSASVNAPRSEMEALKTIRTLRIQHDTSGLEYNENSRIEIVLSIPNRADGVVRLLDVSGSEELLQFNIYKILFCIRGEDNQPDRDCFAFTESHEESGIFQCHVFQCSVPEAVKKVLNSFELAFQSIPHSQPSIESSRKINQENGAQVSPHDAAMPVVDQSLFCFNVTLEIREFDGKGNCASVPWDKASSCFKLRKNLERQVMMTVSQTTNVPLTIERCFGLLLAPGRNVSHADMHLLDMDVVGSDSGNDETQGSEKQFCVSGLWDPTHPHFALLNEETQKGTRVFISVAVDLVVQEIQEPVRLLLETKARIFPQHEKFWYFGKRLLQETFYLYLNEISDNNIAIKSYTVISLESATAREHRLSRPHSYPVSPRTTLSTMSPQDEEDDDDTDEPLLSGSGEVSHDCPELVLTNWGDLLNKWKEDFSQKPPGLKHLVRKGIPNALRGEIWQLLSGCQDSDKILEKYRILLSKDSAQENVILRDIHRTFPAHDYFKEPGGLGQESLYKISKAYSLHDKEVGYCQGLSFIAAALLLHMPEEQAFAVLCKIMQEYQMRELFKNGFEALHTKFYQLERLIEDSMPDLHDHFKHLSIDTHMFSSQWFLTLFTAKFPLSMVYRVLDLFLSEGELVIFKVALSLLKYSRQDLLTLDFEGVLRYFRVSLPKKYRNDENTQRLIEIAISVKVTAKMLKRYEKDHKALQEKLLKKDPHILMEQENHRLMEACVRLEVENDELAEELTTAKITMETQLEKTMAHACNLQQELTITLEELRTIRKKLKETSEENERLSQEMKQVKELCRREMEKQEEDLAKKDAIIKDYKAISSQLSTRIETIQSRHKDELEKIKTEPPVGEEQLVQDESENKEKELLMKQIRNLELSLAQTKLSKVESECKVQELEHQLTGVMRENQSSKITWLHKTLSNITSSKPKENSSSIPSVKYDSSALSSRSRIPENFVRHPS